MLGAEPDLDDVAALAEALAVDDDTLRFRLGDLDLQERRRLAGATRRGT